MLRHALTYQIAARGAVVDEQVLDYVACRADDSRRRLDVFDREPYVSSDPRATSEPSKSSSTRASASNIREANRGTAILRPAERAARRGGDFGPMGFGRTRRSDPGRWTGPGAQTRMDQHETWRHERPGPPFAASGPAEQLGVRLKGAAPKYGLTPPVLRLSNPYVPAPRTARKRGRGPAPSTPRT